ncbi:hypothetical protein K440DRAFT_645250 [Wilcoxina mikolae CBS 423.85]|nr:hypothetical protein K440DRAFT_645250 [Wilcoxina mikolae CBS 423.85]
MRKKQRECVLCSINFKSRDEFLKHVKATPNHSINVCDCDGCCPYNLALHSKKSSRLYRADRPPPTTVHCEGCAKVLVVCTVGIDRHVQVQLHKRQAFEKGLYCETRAETFLTFKERDKHFADLHEVNAPIHCIDCGNDFPTECALESHDKNDPWHGKNRPDICCEPCRVSFRSIEALNNHLASKKHKTIKCLASSLCKKRFKTLAGMTSHLESGACVSSWDRKKIAKFLQKHDTKAVIIEAGAVLENQLEGSSVRAMIAEQAPPALASDVNDFSDTDSDDTVILTPANSRSDTTFTNSENGGVPILTPFDSPFMSPNASRRPSFSSALTQSSGMSTPRSNAGYGTLDEWLIAEKICPKCSRQFGSAQGLQAHMSSTAHVPKIYHCPAFLFSTEVVPKKPQKLFKTLGGMVAHIESGACEGGKEALGKAIDFLKERLGAMGLSQHKLDWAKQI